MQSLEREEKLDRCVFIFLDLLLLLAINILANKHMTFFNVIFYPLLILKSYS